MSARMDPAARALGVGIVTAAAVALILTGVVIGLSAPLLSLAQLLASPLLIAAGGALAARLAFVQVRHARRHP